MVLVVGFIGLYAGSMLKKPKKRVEKAKCIVTLLSFSFFPERECPLIERKAS